MKTPYFFLSFVIFFGVSCTTITAQSDTVAKIKEGVPGGEVVETTRIKATVTAIDPSKRKITLVTPDSKKIVVKAGPEVKNFEQIKIGDQLNAVLTEEVVVRMAKPGEKITDKGVTEVKLAPKGAKPGLVMADIVETSATIVAIDLKRHKATLRFVDGSTKTFAVRKDVELSQRKVGEKIVIRSTEIFAVRLEKP